MRDETITDEGVFLRRAHETGTAFARMIDDS